MIASSVRIRLTHLSAKTDFILKTGFHRYLLAIHDRVGYLPGVWFGWRRLIMTYEAAMETG